MSNRPDHVKCVRTGRYDKPLDEGGKPSATTWCGRSMSFDLAFTDAAHAALNAANKGRLLICPECAKALVDVIQGHTYGTASETNEHGLSREEKPPALILDEMADTLRIACLVKAARVACHVLASDRSFDDGEAEDDLRDALRSFEAVR